jgi:hypothetical protein
MTADTGAACTALLFMSRWQCKGTEKQICYLLLAMGSAAAAHLLQMLPAALGSTVPG